MDWTTIGAFAAFIAIMTGTPGPGNLTFMAIGASSGYKAAFPVILASQIGVLLINFCVAFGLGQIMTNGGPHVLIFNIACMTYMSYLAWRIINLNINTDANSNPPGFLDGLLIHPLSPKSWAMSTVAYASFFAANGANEYTNAVYLATGFILGGLIAHSMWALAGVSILKVLGKGAALRITTITMAIGMLAITAWSLFL